MTGPTIPPLPDSTPMGIGGTSVATATWLPMGSHSAVTRLALDGDEAWFKVIPTALPEPVGNLVVMSTHLTQAATADAETRSYVGAQFFEGHPDATTLGELTARGSLLVPTASTGSGVGLTLGRVLYVRFLLTQYSWYDKSYPWPYETPWHCVLQVSDYGVLTDWYQPPENSIGQYIPDSTTSAVERYNHNAPEDHQYDVSFATATRPPTWNSTVAAYGRLADTLEVGAGLTGEVDLDRGYQQTLGPAGHQSGYDCCWNWIWRYNDPSIIHWWTPTGGFSNDGAGWGSALGSCPVVPTAEQWHYGGANVGYYAEAGAANNFPNEGGDLDMQGWAATLTVALASSLYSMGPLATVDLDALSAVATAAGRVAVGRIVESERPTLTKLEFRPDEHRVNNAGSIGKTTWAARLSGKSGGDANGPLNNPVGGAYSNVTGWLCSRRSSLADHVLDGGEILTTYEGGLAPWVEVPQDLWQAALDLEDVQLAAVFPTADLAWEAQISSSTVLAQARGLDFIGFHPAALEPTWPDGVLNPSTSVYKVRTQQWGHLRWTVLPSRIRLYLVAQLAPITVEYPEEEVGGITTLMRASQRTFGRPSEAK